MGDADSSQPIFSGEEIEAWMDDAMVEMEDGMDNLLTFISMINERTTLITSEIGDWRKFRRCFTALNIFVIPVVMAVALAFSCEILGIDEESKIWQQKITTFLMYVWGTMSLPVYLFAMWETYVKESKRTKSLSRHRMRSVCHETDLNRNSDFPVLESDLLSPSAHNSVERFSEFGRAIIDHIRQNQDRKSSQILEDEPVGEQNAYTGKKIEVSATGDEGEEVVTDLQKHDSGPVELFIQPGTFHTEEGDFCGVNMIIVNPTSDISAEIQKNDETLKQNEAEVRKHRIAEGILVDFQNEQEQHPSLHKTVVKSTGESDKSLTLLKSIDDVGDTNCKQKQRFDF